MKRFLIFLKDKYGVLSAEKLIDNFKLELINFDFISIIKELLPKAQVIIEFPDEMTREAYNLIDLHIVECIANSVPEDEKEKQE